MKTINKIFSILNNHFKKYATHNYGISLVISTVLFNLPVNNLTHYKSMNTNYVYFNIAAT